MMPNAAGGTYCALATKPTRRSPLSQVHSKAHNGLTYFRFRYCSSQKVLLFSEGTPVPVPWNTARHRLLPCLPLPRPHNRRTASTRARLARITRPPLNPRGLPGAELGVAMLASATVRALGMEFGILV